MPILEFFAGEFGKSALFQFDGGVGFAGCEHRDELAQIRLMTDQKDLLGLFIIDFCDEFQRVAIG